MLLGAKCDSTGIFLDLPVDFQTCGQLAFQYSNFSSLYDCMLSLEKAKRLILSLFAEEIDKCQNFSRLHNATTCREKRKIVFDFGRA